jgi:hypothetical protein
LYIDNTGNAGIGTTTPYSVTNYKSVTVNGTNGGIFATQVNGTNAFNISTSSASTYILETRALPIQIGTNNTEKVRILSNGNVGIGTIAPVSLLELNGANAALTLNNAVASTTNLGIASANGSYSTDANAGDFIIRANSKRILLNTDATSAALIMHTTKNITVGSNTDAGFKLDVNGTARINGVLQFGSTPTIESFGANQQIKITSALGLTISSDRWNSNTSTSSYIQNGYSTKSFVITPTANANYNAFDFSSSSAFNPTLSINYNQKLINGAMTINSTGIANFFGIDSRTTDNSASIANNVYAVYADATLGTNTSATRWAGYFVGRGYFSGNVGIGNNSIGGISAASVRLDVRGTTWFSADAYGQLEIIPTIGNGGETVIRQYTTAPRNGGDLRIRVDAQVQGGNLIIATNANNERMRVNAAGNVLIGTATDAGYKLDVNGTFRVQTNGSLLANTTISNLRVGSGAVGFTGLEVAASARFTGGTDYRFLSNGGGQFVLFVDAVNQSVGVGNNSTLNASAVLDLTSTTKGFLPPRLTTTQKNAITTPATGLVVYDTTLNKLSVYTGAGWETVTSV